MKLTDIVGKTISAVEYIPSTGHNPDPDTTIKFTDGTVLTVHTSEWLTFDINGEEIENETD